jgi:hypothetical protein
MPTHKRTTNFINSVSKSIRGYLLICTCTMPVQCLYSRLYNCLYTAYTIGVYTLMQTLLVKSRPLNFQEHRRALLHPTATVQTSPEFPLRIWLG